MKKFFKKDYVIILLILILASFMRLYMIEDYISFLGDEGRDVIVAREILRGEFTLLGPRSSAGDFFMGPFYYYLISPFLFLANYDPVGPAIMVALFGIATVWLIYYTGQKFFNRETGIIAALLYSFSPLVLEYSRSSWNPNILPFFALLIIYLIYFVVLNNKGYWWYMLTGFLIGISLQLHYLSLILWTVVFLYIFLTAKRREIKVALVKNFIVGGGVLASLMPLILFEFLHGFLNSRGIISFVFGENVSSSGSSSYPAEVANIFFRIFGRLITNFPPANNILHDSPGLIILWTVCTLIIAFASVYILFLYKSRKLVLLLSLWLFVSVFLLGFYQKEIHDYLFTFIFPLPFLLTGNMLAFILNKKNNIFYKTLPVLVIAGLITVYLNDVPFKLEPNRQKEQAKKIAKFVIEQTGNKKYNFALLSGGNSDHAYRYYLEILGHEPVLLENLEDDPQRKSATQQLFVVCEDIKCNPIGNPLHEIAAFGRAEIANVWNVSVVKVYKLIPYKE